MASTADPNFLRKSTPSALTASLDTFVSKNHRPPAPATLAAWRARARYGSHEDRPSVLHDLGSNPFHPVWYEMSQDNQKTRAALMQDLKCDVMDALTAWDLMDGRISVLLSCSGQLSSGVSVTIDHIPTDIYFTPREERSSEGTVDEPLALLLQLFIDQIGLPFTKARHLRAGAREVEMERVYRGGEIFARKECPDWPTLPFQYSLKTFISTRGWKAYEIPAGAAHALARVFPHITQTTEPGFIQPSSAGPRESTGALSESSTMLVRAQLNGESEAVVHDILAVLRSFTIHDEEPAASAVSSVPSRPPSPLAPPSKLNTFQRGVFGSQVDAASREASQLARAASDAVGAAVKTTQHAKRLVHEARAADERHRALALQEEGLRQSHWLRTFRQPPPPASRSAGLFLTPPASTSASASPPSSPPPLPDPPASGEDAILNFLHMHALASFELALTTAADTLPETQWRRALHGIGFPADLVTTAFDTMQTSRDDKQLSSFLNTFGHPTNPISGSEGKGRA